MSVSTDDFIKTIFKNEMNEGLDTKPSSIAKSLGITNAAATDMAQKLAVKNIVKYEKYKELKLTKEGERIALTLLRKHRLWETFLYKTLNLSLHEIHREAEMLEHQTSEFITEKISLFLDHPEYDPHGDPIPQRNGILMKEKNRITLSNANEGKNYEVCRLNHSDKEFFDFCTDKDIKVGALLKVLKQLPDNKMTEVQLKSSTLLLNFDFAKTIQVKPISNNH